MCSSDLLVHPIGLTAVLMYGAVVALLLAWYADLRAADLRSAVAATV